MVENISKTKRQAAAVSIVLAYLGSQSISFEEMTITPLIVVVPISLFTPFLMAVTGDLIP